MASTDALRASLDEHEVNKKLGKESRYMESALRRIGEPDAIVTVSTSGRAAKATVASEEEITDFHWVRQAGHPRGQVLVDETNFELLDEDDSTLNEDFIDSPDDLPDPKAGTMHGDYALFRRDLDKHHAAYFFAKRVPEDAVQATVPPGYQVRLTTETDLPYIARRSSEPGANQVRAIRARSRDTALLKARRQGLGGLEQE